MNRPEWFEAKITLGNVLTFIPLAIAAVLAYADLRNDAALLRQQWVRDTLRIDKLEASDRVMRDQFRDYQQQTIQALTRLETQMGILLQERRLSIPPPAPGAR